MAETDDKPLENPVLCIFNFGIQNALPHLAQRNVYDKQGQKFGNTSPFLIGRVVIQTLSKPQNTQDQLTDRRTYRVTDNLQNRRFENNNDEISKLPPLDSC